MLAAVKDAARRSAVACGPPGLPLRAALSNRQVETEGFGPRSNKRIGVESAGLGLPDARRM